MKGLAIANPCQDSDGPSTGASRHADLECRVIANDDDVGRPKAHQRAGNPNAVDRGFPDKGRAASRHVVHHGGDSARNSQHSTAPRSKEGRVGDREERSPSPDSAASCLKVGKRERGKPTDQDRLHAVKRFVGPDYR